MSEMMFEIWVETQINRIDEKYMTDRITSEEYREMMNEINRREEEFYCALI